MNHSRPNIVIIMSDQHHAGVMGCAGDKIVRTPALDALAARGVRFTNTYCPFPLCGPSRMSFLTGRHPHQNALWDNIQELASAIPTFAHAFLAGDYDTILSGRMHFVGADQRHGFAQRLIADVPGTAYLSAGWKMNDVLGPLLNTTGMGLPGLIKSGPGHSGYIAYDQAVTRATTQWLTQRGSAPSQKPFMLTVGYVAPHCPFVAPPEDFDHYARLIKVDDLPPYPSADTLHPVLAQQRKNFQTDPPPPVDAQWRARVAYYGLCSFLDRQVAAVLTALESAGLADNTIILYTSDHGEMLGEHGMWWKSTFYDGACRVPLILSLPSSTPQGAVAPQNVSLMDLGPTLLDMCGLPPLPGASGKSFKSLLTGQTDSWDDTVFAENTLPRSGACSRMVKSGPWKYNVYFGQGAHHNAPPELFNLQSDPGETTDLARDPSHQDTCRRLHELVMQNWDPARVIQHIGRAGDEQKLIANWVNKTNPPEPDPLWFDKPQENWFDNTRLPG